MFERTIFVNSWRMAVAVGLWLLLNGGTLSFAQDTAIESILPKTEAGSGEPASVTNNIPSPSEGEASEEILVEKVTAISLTQWDGESAPAAPTTQPGITVEVPLLGRTAIASIEDYLSAQLGKPLSLSLIQEINGGLVRLIASAGFPVTDVLTPAGQDVSQGSIQFLMIPGRLEGISVTGAKHFKENQIRDSLTLRSGGVVSAYQLAKNMNWLNRNPYRQVNTILGRGSKAGQTNVTVKVQDRKPYRVYAGVENSGTELTGRERVSLGFNHGNIAGIGHQLGVQATASTESSGFNAQSLSYTVPLPWQHELRLQGVTQESDPPEDTAGFDLSAESTQFGARYEIPLTNRTSLQTGLLHSVVLSYDAKESNNDLLFGGTSVLENDIDVSQWGIGYQFRRPDNNGHTGGSITWTTSLEDSGQDANFEAQRAFASSEYNYVKASLNRTTGLPWGLNWRIKLTAQWADGNLLPSEQLGIGGSQTVRGYEEYAQLGDRGSVVNNELHRTFGSAQFPVDFFVFYDWGSVSNVDLLEGEQDNRDLASWGVGANYVYKRNLSFSLSHGRQLEALDSDSDKGDRTHVSVLLSF